MELQFLLHLNFRCLHGKLPIMVRGGTILGCVFVLGGDVTLRRPCRMLWSMQVIGKGFAKGNCQSVRACERTDSATFLAQYIILSFLPQIQRLSPANRATNGTHNRSIFTITQTLFICLNISHSQMSKQTVQFYSTYYCFLLICKKARLTCLKTFYCLKKKQWQSKFIYPFSTLYILYYFIF